MKNEYKTKCYNIPYANGTLDAILNEMAAEGWQIKTAQWQLETEMLFVLWERIVS